MPSARSFSKSSAQVDRPNPFIAQLRKCFARISTRHALGLLRCIRILQRVTCWDMLERIPARGSLGTVLAWLAIAVMLVFWLAVGSVLSAVLSRVTSSGAYREALALAHASTEVQSHLGTDFTPRFPALGFVSARYGSQFTEFSIPVAGSHGSVHLYSVANAIHGVWEFSRVTFVSDDGRFSLDLAPVSGMQNLPAVSAQTVFLLPIGLDSSQPLSWTLPYYKSKYFRQSPWSRAWLIRIAIKSILNSLLISRSRTIQKSRKIHRRF